MKDFQSERFNAQHTGFLLLDLERKDTLINKNGSKYFIPASTAKLFTLYSSLQLLNDTLPSLKYVSDHDKLIVLGTGDPTWLHPYFNNGSPTEFLKRFDSIDVYLDNYVGERFGPGWAWEDYPYYFSPELSALPLYGNVVTLESIDSLKVTPNYFSRNISQLENVPPRDWASNQFYIGSRNGDTLQIPYVTSKKLTQRLLSAEIKKEVHVLDSLPIKKWSILPGIARDSVLKQMLWESDNFLAEQLMLLCSSTQSDTLSFDSTKNFILNEHLNNLRQKPRWVDGSGLSRYNLFTPESMIEVLQKLQMETDSTLLFSLMPRWNSEGTLSKEEMLSQKPFIYAKSGSMGNIYNLCGYLKTKSGRLLAFSFMNNHFRRPSREVRKDIYNMLTSIHLSY